MKKIYLILPIFILSIFIAGCSGGGSSSTPKNSLVDTNISCEDNESMENATCNETTGKFECNTDFSLNADQQCVESIIVVDPDKCPEGQKLETVTGECIDDPSIEEPLVCADNQVKIDGSCEDAKICDGGETLNTETNKCETTIPETPKCKIGEKVNEETNECEIDALVEALTSGKVRDGLISGATMSACKIVANEKLDANTTCSDTDGNGEFKCAIYEKDYEYLVFKALGGTDLGENSDARDDRANVDTLKSVLSREDIENNKESFVTPATTLVVLKASETNWSVEQATTEVQNALGVDSVLVNNADGIKSATIVANILDSLGSDMNRTASFATLSNESDIYSESGVTAGILRKLDSRITSEIEPIFSNQIQSSVENPSDITEKVIDELSVRVEANETVTDVIASNFTTVISENYSTENSVLGLVSEIPTVKTDTELKVVTDKISEILDGVSDIEKATELLQEKLSSDSDISELTVDIVKAAIGETVCDSNQTLNLEIGICEYIPAVEPVVKDVMNSPVDIPALPNNSARTFQDGKFPTLPSENSFSTINGLDQYVEKESDNNYLTIVMTSGEDNQTTPYFN